MMKASRTSSERGAALLIVLLLVATLSFVMLAISEITVRSAARSFNARVRSELLWQALGAEQLAKEALSQALEARNGIISVDDPWASEPLVLPLENGRGAILFAEAGSCFNINSLGGAADPAAEPSEGDPAREFARLARQVGVSEFEAAALAEIIGDWIDSDAARRPQGAEDEYYTGLPTAYRTGNTALASVSEIRAMKGMSRDVYRKLKPLLCAQATSAPSQLNINMLSERHAPLVAALLGDEVSLQAANDIIQSCPPGGYRDLDAFFALPAIETLQLADETRQRFSLNSAYFQARAEIVYESGSIEMTVDFEAGEGNKIKTLSRRIGTEE